MWKRAEGWIHTNQMTLLVLMGVVVLRIPTLFEPYWYGDEGIYLTIGQALNRGVELYRGIHDNKPPLLYLVAAAAGGSLFWFRFIAALWNAVTVWVFGRTYRAILGERGWSLAIVAFALLTNLPLLEGNIANAELFFLLPTLSAFWLLAGKNTGVARVFWAGLLIGAGGMFKIPALLETAVWPLYWLVFVSRKEMKLGEWLVKSAVLTIGAVAPLGASIIYYSLSGLGTEYLSAIMGQNVSYLSGWKEGGAGGGVFNLTGRAVMASVLVVGIWLGKNRWGNQATFLGIWWVVGLFAALLSGRPYPHYLLQMGGVMAMAVTVAAVSRARPVKLLVTGLCVLLLGSVWAFKFWVYPVGGYYFNFASWVLGYKSRQAYFAWFNPRVPVNYRLAEKIAAQSNSDDRLFVWGDEPLLYALSRRLPATRYTAEYHIRDFGAEESTMDQVSKVLPKYIVAVSPAESLPGLMFVLTDNYTLEETVGGTKLYRRAVWYNP